MDSFIIRVEYHIKMMFLIANVSGVICHTPLVAVNKDNEYILNVLKHHLSLAHFLFKLNNKN